MPQQKGKTMRAMQVLSLDGRLTLESVIAERPLPAENELLIRIDAAGVTATELLWYPTTHTAAGEARQGAIPGHEFSGVVVELGSGVTGFAQGQAVYGMNDWFAQGATAEYCVALATSVAAKPARLSHQEAATVPIAALTAWQGLFVRAQLQPGQRVLVQGGAGGVGLFAVQLAHHHGAHVVVTTSAATLEFVQSLGADEVIDYRASDFRQQVRDMDVVFDTVGGETGKRSPEVLKPGGRLISIAAEGEVTTDPVVRAAYFIVEPSRQQLEELGRLLDAGEIKTFVKAAVPLEEAAAAYAGTVESKLGYGKVVIAVNVERDDDRRAMPSDASSRGIQKHII